MVFLTLIGFMTGTSALLFALQQEPLKPDTINPLYASRADVSLDAIFQTQTPATTSRWRYIYVHHARSHEGNARTLADVNGNIGDHFVIGNGRGAADGEIQISQRWLQQQSGLPPAGAGYIDPTCISICLVGDFDRAMPTNVQLQVLNQLVATLQHRLKIPADNVIVRDVPNSAAGIGQYFPTSAFRAQLLK